MEVKPGYKLTEVGVIPEEWDVSTIKSLAAITTGPFGTLLKASEYSSQQEGVPVISVGEIQQGYIKTSPRTPFVGDKVIKRLPQYILSTGNIVFARKGGVDRSAVISCKENGWFLGSDGISLSFKKKICSEFLGYQFSSTRVQQTLLQRSTGTTMPSMNQEILGSIEVVLPLLSEQNRIAKVIGDMDSLIKKLETLIAKKRDIKQAAIQQLLTGQKRLPGFCKEWEALQLGSVIEKLEGGGTPSRSNPAFWGKEIPWVTVKDFITFSPFHAQEAITHIGLKNSASHLI
ncbi:MAG: restriction endonuclease subunit S [Rectinemataceae bacterium]|nr:restriction endonuclease subunit S [Rectinemataceae bacterium]